MADFQKPTLANVPRLEAAGNENRKFRRAPACVIS
jgi:hypothetical protein